MSINKMLIDATHPEETRVVVLKNGRVEEFDFESAARKLLRGNIYLAKVTRVEPSLQAAFVDYGGNRHGFLAFSEIHPDYYQIPVADRQALIEEEAAQEAAEEAEVDAHAERLARRRQGSSPRSDGQRSDGRGRNGGRGDRDGRRERINQGPAPESFSDHEDRSSPSGHAGEASGGAGETGPELGEAGHHAQHHHEGHDAGEHGHTGHQGGAAANDARDHHDLPAAGETGHGGVHDHDDEFPRTIAAEVGDVVQIVSEPAPPVTVGGFDPDAPSAHDDDHDQDHDHHDAGNDGAAADHDAAADAGHDRGPADADADDQGPAEPIDETGSQDMVEELPQRPRRRLRSYKIQEVIKRRQIILVQVVKEERGNKGAALTTYLSLAGRYTVLMPNTARGGGISRKITQPGDRKRLKAIANELEVPEGMGLIIRTAGAARSGQEIRRDYEYLLRLWESVRQLTLESTAPSLVYEEGNLIKRSIRDLYNKDVEEVVVAGDVAHREAQDFMRMLMPSHAKNVIQHKGGEPLFTRYRMEQQLAAMFSPQVTLKSGGYLVINQTEALVAIDVNSGKSTREYSIEETALNTNLEAADEIARQLKLRDLAGLIVIDFIDMEEKRNNRNVERRLKDALRFDRARIQLGRISHFGLMEMSRQRLRTGVLEGSTTQCPHCQGTGIIRSIESIALAVIRGLEDALMSGTRMALVATTTSQVALYILNSKRAYITDMEARHGLSISVQGSDKLQGANFTIDKVAASAPANTALRRTSASAVNMEWGFASEDGDEGFDEESGLDDRAAGVNEAEGDAGEENDGRATGPRGSESRGEDGEGRKRRRRRGRRGRRDDRPAGELSFANGDQPPEFGADDDVRDGGEGRIIEIEAGDDEPEEIGAGGQDLDGNDGDEPREPRGEGDRQAEGDGRGRRRRRGRRGGRRNGRDRERPAYNDDGTLRLDADGNPVAGGANLDPGVNHAGHGDDHDHDHERSVEAPEPAGVRHAAGSEHGYATSPLPEPAPARMAQAQASTAAPRAATPPHISEPEPDPQAPAKPRRAATSSEPVLERVVVSTAVAQPSGAEPEPAKPVRRGWWQKKLGLE